MKRIAGSLALACAFAWTVLASQDPAANKPRTVTSGQKSASPDAPFVGTAAMDSLAEVEQGRVAARNASSPEVKQFAQRMVDDHTKAGSELAGLAAHKEITLATKLDREHRTALDGLAKLNGAAFDKAYMAQMAKAHSQAVMLFQQEAKGGQDAEVKAWAAKALPMLQEHLKLASTLSATIGTGQK